MNSQLTLKTLSSIIDTLINLRLTKSTEKSSKLQNNIKQLDTKESINTQIEIAKIFQKLAEKKGNQLISLSSKALSTLRLTFRTFNSYTFQQTSSEIWLFQICQTEKQYNKGLDPSILKNYLLSILTTINQFSTKKVQKSNQNEKSTFIDYQIQYNCQNSREEPFTDKVRLEIELFGSKISTLVIYPSTNNSILLKNTSYGRKLSSETNYTESGKTNSKLTRKVSVYSFYDQQSDITILTNDNRAFECQFQEESILLQDEEEQDCELIETEEDCKLREFKQRLNELSQQIDPFWLSI